MTTTPTMTRDLTGRSTVAGLFQDRSHAQQAVQDLKAAGFREDQIGIAVRDRDEQNQLIEDTGTHAASDAGKGVVGGGILGGLVGLLVGLGALAIPGIGPVVAGGVLAHAFGIAGGTAIAGAGIGAVSGGIVGALIGLGIPEHEARHFETGFNSGGTLVTVTAESRAQEAIAVLERDGGDTGGSLYSQNTNMASPVAPDAFAVNRSDVTAALAAATPSPQVNTTGDRKVELYEEELHAQKQQVQAGEVTLHKDVITETKTLDVPVTREEVVIERHAVTDREVAPGSVNFDDAADKVIRVPVMEEQVTVQKTPFVTEEVSLGKRQVTETQHVSDTVRREEVHIDNPGNVSIQQHGNTTLDNELDEDGLDTDVNANRTNTQIR